MDDKPSRPAAGGCLCRRLQTGPPAPGLRRGEARQSRRQPDLPIDPRRLCFLPVRHRHRRGLTTSRGVNPPSLFKYAAESRPKADGFVEGGETVPTVLGAQQENAKLWGGEADDLDIKASVLAAGVSDADLLGFYVLRNIPQWIGERKIEDAGDTRLKPLAEAALAKSRATLQLPTDVLSGYAEWAEWYERLNRKRLGAGFATEEVGPLADGRFGTNRIAFAISRARSAHLHKLIIDHLNARESVLVVFGASHLMIQRPALDAAVGKPCYVGSELGRAASACR